MAVRSLNQRVFRLSSGLVLLCACAILVNVWLSTLDHAKNQLNNNLQVAQSVIQQVLESQELQLFSSADVLTQDYGFKSAIGSQDSATIDDVLANFGSRIDADVMALISLDGEVSNSTSDALVVGQPFAYPNLVEQALYEGGASEILILNNRVYQMMLLLIDVPGAPAVSVLGFEIDIPLLELMKRITQLELSLTLASNTQSTHTTLPEGSHTQLQIDDLSWYSMPLLTRQTYISQSFVLNQEAQSEVLMTMSEDAERLFGDFNTLLLRVTFIAILSVLLAMVFGAAVAKKLAKPLHRLSVLAQSISSGNYQQDIDIKASTTEIDELSASFQSMQENIRERQEQVSYQASHDLLTELQNRYRISEVIDQRFASAVPFQAIGANILGFRGVNDIFGYHNGDKCLQVVASRFKLLGGQSARLNGGEFLWIPDEHLSIEQIKDIQHQIELPIIVDDVVMNVRIAMGVLTCPEDCQDTESVLRRINISLDEARSVPGLLVNYKEDFEQRYTRRLSIITELKKALVANQDELKLAYQPKLKLSTGKVTHVEALIRWINPTLGFVPPDEFIGIAEQAGLIGQVTDFVIGSAVDGAKAMADAGLDVCIAINLSAKDILNPNLLKMIARKLKHVGVDASRLSFEITESDLVSDPEKAVVELQKFRDAGFSLAIDDFGTGYSSLAYLKQLPVTELKIDKSFVLQLDQQKSDQQIVQTILELAHNFGLGVIAEGAENQATLQLLKDWGCEYVQGYHICRPISVDDVIAWCIENENTEWFDK